MLKNIPIEKAVKKRFPEPVALVISRDSSGKVNLCPFGFFALMAWEPKVWAIGSYEKHYTTKVINETEEFVLCLPAIEQVEDVLYAGSVHGWEVDKTKQLKNLKFKKSKFVKPPVIEDSIACFECKVIRKIKIADHFVFFGKIVAAHQSEKSWEEKLYNWDDKRLGTMKLGKKYQEITYSPEGENN